LNITILTAIATTLN